MKKFRKKPVVIEAVQWLNGQISETPTPEWIGKALRKNMDEEGAMMRIGNEIRIATLEGEMTASDGDWLIQGVSGEIYPCKPDIFKQTYEEEKI